MVTYIHFLYISSLSDIVLIFSANCQTTVKIILQDDKTYGEVVVRYNGQEGAVCWAGTTDNDADVREYLLPLSYYSVELKSMWVISYCMLCINCTTYIRDRITQYLFIASIVILFRTKFQHTSYMVWTSSGTQGVYPQSDGRLSISLIG